MRRINTVIMAPARRRDENLPDYPDKGCELAPRCLECALPRCRFDTVDGKQWRRRPKGIPNRRKKQTATATGKNQQEDKIG